MGTLRAAVCMLLLNAPEGGKTFWVLCGGDHGGVIIAREIHAAREVDRRVLLVGVGTESWAHNLSEESDWPGQAVRHSTPVSRGAFHLVLSDDVVDAEGRYREQQVGDEATGGKRVKSTPYKDMTKR